MAELGGRVMKCIACDRGRTFWFEKFKYDKPDKYEQWQKIKHVKRAWHQCSRCGFYHQTRDYSLERLQRIYQGGYRNPEFRSETIEESFKRISSMPYARSENKNRYDWYSQTCNINNILDIGSGIGVWPALLKSYGANVVCVEENKYSTKFITESLGLPCYKKLADIHSRFETITLIHVLEHIQDPILFLTSLHRLMYSYGNLDITSELFIEVPDDQEFNYLEKDHDEFNSCHVYFYSMASLYKILEKSGFLVKEMHREYYPYRSLSRVMAVAQLRP
jgi:2-polyprenyl-3-methyl-5-hydroxy-6-metoxy-1,4-benzoquinol methylase